MTSRHLLEEGELLRVVLPDGRETSGKTEGLCQVKDIGFVVVPEDLPEKEKVNGASSDAAEKKMCIRDRNDTHRFHHKCLHSRANHSGRIHQLLYQQKIRQA